jgi:hypothetical protein
LSFVLCYSYFRHFSYMLCVLFQAKCLKSKSATHFWVTGGSAESIIHIKFLNCCCSHKLCGHMCPTALPTPQAAEHGVAARLQCRFVQRLAKYSEFSLPDGSKTQFQLSRPIMGQQFTF